MLPEVRIARVSCLWHGFVGVWQYKDTPADLPGQENITRSRLFSR
jgi:hypothetical protein